MEIKNQNNANALKTTIAMIVAFSITTFLLNFNEYMANPKSIFVIIACLSIFPILFFIVKAINRSKRKTK